ncbi:MAG: hypothetical protein NT084_06320 [Bacteroidetes bacterium]|jgi:hypothetical protein|nr:hypothetical protein [Bacteroidota bacterium]
MNATSTTPLLIDKDQVKDLRFPSVEILTCPEQIARRTSELSRALTLGNVHHNKVKIIFSDLENIKMIETTIWAVTELRIILKSGMVIPINRIMEIIS